MHTKMRDSEIAMELLKDQDGPGLKALMQEGGLGLEEIQREGEKGLEQLAATEPSGVPDPSDGYPKTAFWEKQMALGRGCTTLGAGVKRYINVDPGLLRWGRDVGEIYPSVTVRDADSLYVMFACREVEILGPSTIRHTPGDQLPCSGERGGEVYIETEGAVRCYLDPGVTSLPASYEVWAVAEGELKKIQR